MKLGAWAKHATLALQPGEKRQSSAPKLPPTLQAGGNTRTARSKSFPEKTCRTIDDLR